MQINIANFISLFRVFSVPAVIIAAYYCHFRGDLYYMLICYLLLFSAISDFLDGFIARKTNSVSLAGTILDPLADKLFLNTLILIVFIKSYLFVFDLPWWAVVLFLSKDIMLIVGSILLFIVKAEASFIRPAFIGKIATSLEFGLMISIFWGLPYWIVMLLFIIAMIMVGASGFYYVSYGMKVLKEEADLL